MTGDILKAELVVNKGKQDSSPVYADFLVQLSDSFSAPTIAVNFNNIIDNSSRDRESEQQWVSLKRNASTGQYIARIELSPYSPSATYQIKALNATDINGRDLHIEQNSEFPRLGLNNTQYNFTNPFSDSTAPAITSVLFGQWRKTDSGEISIDVSFKVKDDLSGIGYSANGFNEDSQYVYYNNPAGGRSFDVGLNGPSDFYGVATVGDQPDQNGEYSGTGKIVLNKYAPSGKYVFQLRIPDRAGNTFWGDRYISGLPASIDLINPLQDITPPSLTGLKLSGSFDGITGRPVVNFKGKLLDDLSGVQSASINLEGPDGSRTITDGGVKQDNDGNFNVNIPLSIPFVNGKYNVSGVATDNARNDIWWSRLTDVSIFAPSEDNPSGVILRGSDVSDLIFGSKGNDQINGGKGADEMLGGRGDDLYKVDNIGDKITEEASAGNDTVETSIDFSIASLADIENITLIGTGKTGIGNDSANKLIGDAANNNLNGGAGQDTLIGLSSTDSTLGRATVDTLTGGTQNDLFVLGDSRGFFYSDGSTASSGRNDYARITDFSNGDRIQLKGKASDYLLKTSDSVSGLKGIGLYRNDGVGSGAAPGLDNRDEFIALIQVRSGTSILNLNNNSQFFIVV